MLVSISSRPGSTLVTSLLVATSIPFQPFAGGWRTCTQMQSLQNHVSSARRQPTK